MTPAERYAAHARAVAHGIVSNPPFATRPHGENFADRVATSIGHAIHAVFNWIGDALRRYIFHPVSSGAKSSLGSAAPLVLVVVGACLVVAVAVGILYWRRTRPSSSTAERARREPRSARAARLLDEAEAAWRAGELDAALRLRFEAGLERLEDRGVVRDRASLTTAELSATLSSGTFDDLASTHTLVAYAGVHASDRDVENAFDRWPVVVDDARRSARVPT